jgi:hypothetical protein
LSGWHRYDNQYGLEKDGDNYVSTCYWDDTASTSRQIDVVYGNLCPTFNIYANDITNILTTDRRFIEKSVCTTSKGLRDYLYTRNTVPTFTKPNNNPTIKCGCVIYNDQYTYNEDTSCKGTEGEQIVYEYK